jgi:hypothetical protein
VTVPFTAALGDPAVDRLYFRLSMPPPEDGTLYWVRPMLTGLTGEGWASDAMLPGRYHPPTGGEATLVISDWHIGTLVLEYACSGDENGDGVISPADCNQIIRFTPEAQQPAALAGVWAKLGLGADRFNVYASADGGEYPAADSDPSTIQPLATIDVHNHLVGWGLDYALADLASGQYVWVRAAWGDVEGQRSNLYVVP